MKELINFIPKTVAECRNILVELRDNPNGVALCDRYGREHKLDEKEEKTLAELIEKQIGEKTPKAAPAAAVKNNPKKPTAKK